MRDLSFILLLGGLCLACALPAWRRPGPPAWMAGLAAYLGLSFAAALAVAGVASFTFIRLFSHAVFLVLPAYFVLAAWKQAERMKILSFGLAGAVLVAGADAFLVEPRWLEVN